MTKIKLITLFCKSVTFQYKRYKIAETISIKNSVSHSVPREPILKFGNMCCSIVLLLKISILRFIVWFAPQNSSYFGNLLLILNKLNNIYSVSSVKKITKNTNCRISLALYLLKYKTYQQNCYFFSLFCVLIRIIPLNHKIN